MNHHFTTVKELPDSEKPYEKFLISGVESLSDAELIAVIIRSGTRGTRSVEVAQELLRQDGHDLLNLYTLSVQDMQKIPGIGQVKAIQLKCIAELSKRMAKTRYKERICLGDPGSIASYYMEDMRHESRERTMVLLFDAKCRLLEKIDAIPALAESGIFSFKIEGRMKQAEYAAGVVSVYRQYMDRYLDRLNEERAGGCSEDEARRRAKKAYAVTEEDHRKLLALGNRSGFTDGYYFRRNGREMITFDSPGHAKTDEALQKTVREHYIKVRPEQEIKEKINGFLRLKKDLSATLKLQCEGCEITCEGEQVLQAQKQPLSRDRVDVCMRKTGNTPFAFEQLAIEMDEDVFLPVQALNALRREALLALEEKLLQGYRRDGAASPEAEKLGCGADKRTRQEERREAEDAGKTVIVSLENRCLLSVVLRSSFVHEIYADSSCYTRDELWMALLKDAGEAHLAGKKFYFILPAVFRSRTAAFYRENIEHLKALPLDGFVAKSYDAAAFVRQELGAETPLILDHSLYSWNSAARDVFLQLAPERDTVPLELNRSELFARDNHHSEAMVYGYLPLMTSAQCVHANTEKCDRERGILYLKDRYGKYFPVKNNCTECYNTIYNTTPLMLFDERADFLRMGIAAYRISFTIEEEEQAAFILDLFERTFLSGKHSVKELFPDGYTRGHYKRGVE